ncbi:MAG TPA: hypothetical protein VGE79_17125, partial [Niastella sp.]
MKMNFVKLICFLLVISFSIGCAKKESNLPESKTDNTESIKEIAFSPEIFDEWAKTVITTKFGSVTEYSIKEVNIKSIDQFKIAEVIATVAGNDFNYFVMTPATFVEQPQIDKYILRPLDFENANGRILVFAKGETSAHTDITYA